MSFKSRGNDCRSVKLLSTLCIAVALLTSAAQATAAGDLWPLTVIVTDESGSMQFRESPHWLAEHLPAATGNAPIMYSMVAFGGAARIIDNGVGTLWPASELSRGVAELRMAGGVEDGFAAVKVGLREFDVFPDAALHMLLVTDEDRDVVDSSVDAEELEMALAANGTVLDALLSVRLICDGQRAMALDASGAALLPDGAGGYTVCANGDVVGLAGSAVRNYVLLALGSGGSVWDINLTGYNVRGQSYPAADAPIRSSIIAAFTHRLEGYWQGELSDNRKVRAEVRPLLSSVGTVLQLAAKAASLPGENDKGRLSYEWFLNGELQSVSQAASLVVSTPGRHRVSLRVTDADYSTKVSEQTVAIWVTE